MLRHLKLVNVGPAPEMHLDLAPRLNVLTGDNGLGKSFLLDIAWWALTRRWPSEINKKLPAGLIARPQTSAAATIEFDLETGEIVKTAYDRKAQSWRWYAAKPIKSNAICLYAMADGSFAVWDPARNYFTWTADREYTRIPAYVFSPREVWDGLRDDDDKLLCNGLIVDWASWQNRNGTAFLRLRNVLHALSTGDETMEPGDLTRISIDDPRDIPTIRMTYGESVPVVHASAGMRRIISLAYLLVWSWEEHLRASQLLDQAPTTEVMFLLDEIEAHLHPRWQRSIVRSIVSVVESMDPYTRMISESTDLEQLPVAAHVQIMMTTHSPLVMASLEPYFDVDRDAWFDLDLVDDNVEMSKRPFIRRGDVSNWLVSDAFDMPTARSEEAEKALQDASIALSDERVDAVKARIIEARLREVLGDTDPFWTRWRYVAEKKGWS